MALTSRTRQRRPCAIAARRETVERAEAYLRAHMETPIPVSRLCRIVGLSERGLRNAFYGVRGMSPKRCMVAERLQGARRALNEARPRLATVTGVAADYGFFELGRFAATYKAAFGETPSETLRARGRKSAADAADTERLPQCLPELAQ